MYLAGMAVMFLQASRIAPVTIAPRSASKLAPTLKTWIENNGIRSREDMRTKVADDFKIAQNSR